MARERDVDFPMAGAGVKDVALRMRKAVLLWYGRNKRDLPWRRTEDPWIILVSESMLQQTQVDRVIPKFLAFTRKWPTVRAFAKAPLSTVITAWQGLGYNRRAVFLHRAAAVAVERHGGTMPTDPEALIALPGIGPYTANAVAAFAGNRDVVLWDTNVKRIASRVFFGGEFARKASSDEVIRAALAAALPKGRSRDWYNALMDLGSAVCTSRAPKCGGCPLAKECVAAPRFLKGDAPKRRLVRPQGRFEGSLRQVRGAALRAVTEAGGAMGRATLQKRLGREDAGRAIEGLINDGLLAVRAGRVVLP